MIFQCSSKQSNINLPPYGYRAGILIGLKVLLFASSILPLFSGHTLVWSAGLVGKEAEVIQLTNSIRQEHGASILSVSNQLNFSAEAKANDMATNGYFNHADQNGNRLGYWITATGYNYLRAGENLAKGFSTSTALVQAWVNSPTHYANLINANYREIGIGIAEGYIDGRLTVFVVQHFGEPMPKINLNPVNIAQSISNFPSVLGDNFSRTSDTFPQFAQSDEATIMNTSPAGLFWVAYGDAKYGLRQTIMPGALASDETTIGLPDRGYHTAQILFVVLAFLGLWGWLSMLMWPVYAWIDKMKK